MEPRGGVGVIDACFADLRAAEECHVIDSATFWLASQEKTPKTQPSDIWYSVVLDTGAVLVGEQDLELVR